MRGKGPMAPIGTVDLQRGRRSAILRRGRARWLSSVLLAWLACQPAWSWAGPAASDPAPLGDVSVTHDAMDLSVELEGEGVRADALANMSPEPADDPEDAPGSPLAEMPEVSDPVAVTGIRSGDRDVEAEGQPVLTDALAADPRETLEALVDGPTWRLGPLRLVLPAFPDSWEPLPPTEPDSYKFDTSFSRKGSIGLGDGVWNRMGIQSSRVNLNTGGRISFFGEVAHQLPYSLTWDTPSTKAPQALRLGFVQAGKTRGGQKWEYGFQYRSLDPRFERFGDSELKKDEAGTEAWIGWRAGPLRVRSFASQTWNNLAEDPAKDRTTELLGGVGVELALPSSTWLKLSYAQGTADRSREFLTGTQRRRFGEIPRTSSGSLEKLSASIYRWTEKWDASLSSSYTPTRNTEDPGQQTVSLSQDLSLSFRPTEKLGSTMVVSLWQERQEWSSYQSEGSTTSLSLWYGPFLEGHTLALWGSYDRGRSNDGYWDTQSVNASGTLSRRLGRTFLGDAWLSLEAGYNLYLDGIASANSTDEVYGRIVFKLFDF